MTRKTKLKKALESPELKYLTKLVKAVCQEDNNPICWDIDLNPDRPYELGFFSSNDSLFSVCPEGLHDFIVSKYRHALEFFNPLYIIATDDDESVWITGKPVDDFDYILHDSGLYISHSGSYLPDIS